MILENEKCSIEIKEDTTYVVDSVDNKHYDVVLNPNNYQHSDITKTISICIDLFSKAFFVALIGSYSVSDLDCAILDNETLIVLLNDTIVQISILNGNLIGSVKFDCSGCNFAIYKVKCGYIIYGEMEITMLDFNFKKKWSFSGRDIFVSISGKQPIELCENSIKLYDFADNFYKINYNGNLIK